MYDAKINIDFFVCVAQLNWRLVEACTVPLKQERLIEEIS